MRVTQTVVAIALVAAGVAAEANLPVLQQSHTNAVGAQKFASNAANQSPAKGSSSKAKAAAPVAAVEPSSSSSTSSISTSTSTPSSAAKIAESSPKKAEPAVKAAAPQTPPKAATGKKSIIDKAADVTKLVFGKVDRQRQRVEKKPNAQYVRKQKSASEITTDSTGTKQPASLSDPKVNVMEAMADLVKRYAGQTNPDKAQLQEDLKTVFESRAEKGDLTTKQFRQGYKMKKLKPNGVGKRSTKTKRDLEARDVEEAELDIAARDAEIEEELEIMAREAEPEEEFDIEAREAEAEADPEAMVYEDEVDLFTREFDEDENTLVTARDELDEETSKTKSSDDDKSDDKSVTKSSNDDSSDESQEDSTDLESKKAALKKAIKKKIAAKKLALKKKIAAKKLALKKKLAAKRKAAMKKAAAARKAHQKSASLDDDDDDDESTNVIIVGGDEGDNLFSTSRFSKSSSKSRASKNKKSGMAKLRAAVRAAKQRAAEAEDEHDGFFTAIPPIRPERPFYRAPGNNFFATPMAMHFPGGFDMHMDEM